MIQDPETTKPDQIPNEDEADSSGAGYGNHGDADDAQRDRHSDDG